MGRIVETVLDRFDGGVVSDPRDPRKNVALMVTNFDVHTNPKKLIPYNSSESGDSSGGTQRIQNFCIARRGNSGTTYSLFGLGLLASGGGDPQVFYRDIASDLADATWTDLGASATFTPTSFKFECFVPYRLSNGTTLLFGFHISASNGRIFAIYSGAESGVDTNAAGNLTLLQTAIFTGVAQGLVHSKDDILYLPYDNKIAKKNGGTTTSDGWTLAAITFPSHLVITSICEYGNFIAVAMAPITGNGNSRLFLWNRDSTLATLSESIDLGPGNVRVLGVVEGELVAISQQGGLASTGGGNPDQNSSRRDRVTFRYLVGNRMKKFLELKGGSNTTILPIAKQEINDRLYFMLKMELNQSPRDYDIGQEFRDAVWSIGLSREGQFVLVNERSANNDTELGSGTGDNLYGFFIVGDYMFITYADNSTYAMSKTNDSATTYSHTSIYETKRYNTGDSSLKKDLVGVSVMHEYLPSGASVTVKYRKDTETTFTTILTSDTANDIHKSAMIAQTSPAALPRAYKEIEFRLEATGGAEITGFSFQEDIVGGRIYEAIWNIVNRLFA